MTTLMPAANRCRTTITITQTASSSTGTMPMFIYGDRPRLIIGIITLTKLSWKAATTMSASTVLLITTTILSSLRAVTTGSTFTVVHLIAVTIIRHSSERTSNTSISIVRLLRPRCPVIVLTRQR